MGFAARIDEFHERARALTGLDDFGEADYREPLELLLSDYDAHNRFTPLGAELLAGDIVGRLAARLRAYDGFRRYPGFANSPVEQPLVIVGMARSGTTALHRLLAQDRALQTMPLWLAGSAMPRPPESEWAAHVAYQRAQQGVDRVYALVPEFRDIHPVAAGMPDEDRIVTEQCFWGGGLASMGTAPSYADWTLSADASYAYHYHQRVLGLVAAGDSRRWLLKCPIHIWGLDTLLSVHPDARIVFTHRSAIKSLASLANMLYLLRRVRHEEVTPERIGREVLHNWGRALDRAERMRARHPGASILDVSIDQIQRDPLGTVVRVYSQFRLELTDATRQRMVEYISTAPQQGHGGPRYSPATFGLAQQDVERAVGAYLARNRAICGSA